MGHKDVGKVHKSTHKVGSIYLFIVSRPVGTHIGYILTITALRLTACTVFLKVSPLRGDYRSPLKLKINNLKIIK